jgi:hypothetical protein
MLEALTIPVLKTPQELERAIQRYKAASDQWSNELFSQWQAIRMAALAQASPDPTGDEVPGEDSY